MFRSTEYVFDGEKPLAYETDDPVAPMSVYGRTKGAGEAVVREILAEACIARTSWLFGVAGKCFPTTILRLAGTQRELSVVADQRGSPTFNRDMARAIMQLCRAGARGTVHVTNSGDCSWYEFAQEMVRGAGLTEVIVKPIGTDESSRPAARPKNSVLSNGSLRRLYGTSLPTWPEAWQVCLREKHLGSVTQEPCA